MKGHSEHISYASQSVRSASDLEESVKVYRSPWYSRGHVDLFREKGRVRQSPYRDPKLW